jgi:MFS family permease
MTTTHVNEPRTATAVPPGPPSEQVATGWVRAAALGGLVFFVLLMAFATLTSNSPAASDSRQEVFDYLTQHHGRLQLAAALYGLAMPAALLFLSGLFAALRKAEGGRSRLAVAALAGGGLAAAATVTGALVLGTTANRFPDLGPDGTRVFWTMFLLSIGATLTGEVLAIGATAAIGLRSGLFSRWFMVASVILAVMSGVGVFTLGFTGPGIQTVAGVTAVLNAVWILLASFYLWRRPELATD